MRESLDLESLVDEFVLLTEGFEDLNFPDRGGTLLVEARVPRVQCLRIEIPAEDSLRLTSVIIDADGLDDPVAQTTRKATLPVNPAYGEVLEGGRLLDPTDDDLGLHTRVRPRPWLEITFDEPRDLRSVLVRNAIDEKAIVNRGIQVLVRTADGWWSTLYDGVEREQQFQRTVERHFAGRVGTRRLDEQIRRRLRREPVAGDHGVAADLVRLMSAIQTHDYRNVFRDLDRVGLEPEVVSDFRKLVTDKALARRELEWNIHGIRRSFRFWSEQEKQEYVGFAVDVMNCLRQLNDNVCFGFGSTLGIVRDQQLIPHDDDADVLIGFEQSEVPSLNQGLAMIEDCLRSKGFIVLGEYTSYRWVLPPSGKGSKLDAFVGLIESDDSVSWYPGKRGALTREMMFPPSYRTFHGHDCPIPRQPEAYLEQIYGKDWRVPNPHFRHTWRRKAYADIKS